ncbi:MAG: hypothetical protein HYY04_02645 [Chloroflexi bacterium]|nr:hypothetical protein [Chloroflexota bacterium]
MRGLGLVPPLDGDVAVSPKAQAEVALVSPEGDPVLAAGQDGLGRAVAWTPDVAGRWSRAWAGSPAATTLWGNALSWLLPPRETGELVVRVEAVGESASIVAENHAAWDHVRPTRAVLRGPDGQRQEIVRAPAGPGRDRAHLKLPLLGAYVVQVTQTTDDGAELRGEAGWVAPYPAEYREVGADHFLLAQVATAGGGRVLGDSTEAVALPTRSISARWSASPLLLILAALLWPLEIASRRLALPRAAIALPLRRCRPQPEGAAGRQPDAAARSTQASPPAVATTQRLLEQQRARRERQGPRAGT